MKCITSLSKVLILASGLYLAHNKSIAQTLPPTLPSSCIASPEAVTLSQPNGTSITVVGKGNLNNHWTETVDGYSVVRNTAGDYEYASKLNGILVPTGVLASNPLNRSTAELAYVSGLSIALKPNPNPLKTSILNQVNAHLQNKTFPTTGNIRVLALLIDYPDLVNVIPKSGFDSLLYGANYRSGDGSFKAFYETSSGGLLTVTVDVKGWYRASNNFQYYAADSGYDRAADLVREAVDAAELAGTNFGLYDNDADGDVDGILSVHSGPGAEIGSQSGLYVWSHRWVLNGGNTGAAFYDNVSINDYMINPETRSASNQNISGIGVFCHEFGHNLGLPDLYDTDNSNGNSEGIGNWCVMAGGTYSGSSNRPSGFSAWCKEDLSWDTPQILTLGQTGSYSLNPASTNQNEFYRINTTLSNEYFLVENRQLVGRDSDLPGHGLAIWHINTNKTNSFGNRVNGDETLKGVDLEEADGNNDLDNQVNRGDAGDLFPGTSSRTTFTDNTNPSAQTYLLGNTGLQIRNIVEVVGGAVSFDFGQAPGPPCSASTTFTTNTGSFDDGSGAGLDYVNNQTCAWLITPASGTVTLSFSAFDIEPTNDTVTIYDGANINAALIGKFSGNSIPANVTSTSNSMYVQFKSNATISAPGFDASFITNVPSTQCSGSTTLTASSDNFTDGSGTSNYNNNQNCSWLIQPAGAASITFGLTSLATEISTDIITIYDGPTSASPILGSFSGTNNLNTFTSSTGSIFVTFITNGSVTDQGFDAFYTSSTSNAGCSGSTTLTATSGSFSDGSTTNNYNNNQFCSWLIQPASGTVTLSFSAFATEASSDRVLVFDGVDNAAPQIGNFSGSSIPANLTSTSNSLYLEFRTNGTVTDAGWDAAYTTNSAACSGTTNLTAASGTIDDGSGTANYQNNANCSWLIQPAGSPASITFNINSINLGDIQDRVRVYDGTSNAGTLIGNFFLNNTGAPVIAYGGSMFVEFTSNGTTTGAGWSGNYSSSNTFCSPNNTFSALSGTFTDGSQASSNYLDNSDCSWLIQPTGLVNRVISLRFNRFATELTNDTVTIYDGTTTADPILASYSGSLTSVTTVVSTGTEMLVTFKTNGSTTATGWNAIYNDVAIPSCSGNTTLTAVSGTFDDGSATTSNYTDNLNCSWLVQPAGAGRVTLNFNRFSTEGSFDFVTIYDGSSSSAAVLGAFSGSSIPQQVISSGSSLFVEFTSDGNTNVTGWEANYTSITAQCFPLTSLLNSAGNVADGSNAKNYQDNLSCSWLIEPARAGTVTATFNSFSINSPGDTLYFYNGINNSTALIGKFTGLTPPTSVTANGGKMFVEFITDGTQNDTGWDFDYTSFIPPSCSGLTTLVATSGTIEDGSLTNNYDDNLSCTWLIQPAGSPAIINFDMTSLNLNTAGGFTTRDRVVIYDGTNNTAPVLRTFIGTFFNGTVSAYSGAMFIEFTTNTTGTDLGWEGTYSSSATYCVAQTTYTANNGNFTDGSPNGQNYLDNTDCNWLIQPATPNVAVSLQFFQFNTESINDTVTVYDGATTSDPILATISGNSPTITTLLSSGGNMLVTFKTNASTTATGWRASYNTQQIPACNGTTTLTGVSGTFDDGTAAASNYAPNLNCSWLVQPAAATLITLNFNRFDTQNNGDFVSVYDGSNNSAALIGTYSGNTIPAVINSSGNSLFVEFTSNGFLELTGWEASYVSTNAQCFSNLSITAYNGTLEDGSGTANYQDNLACSWLIEPALATSITATFNSFDISNPGDTLFFYDGNSATATQLAAYTGGTIPAAVSSTGNQLFVEFITDGSTNSSGWDFNYTTTIFVSCAGTTNLTAPSATFDDGSLLSANYDNNLSCEWLIQPTGNPATISFNLSRISLGNNGDRIQIYNNATGSGFPIGQYFGTNLGNPSVSFTGVMLVRFTTDGSSVSNGWEGTYNSSSSYCQPNTTFTNNNGNFDDGSPFGQNYLDNTNCEWLIQPTAANVAVRLNFFGFDTEAGNDTVTIYNGATSAAPILGTFSGNITPPVITSSGGDMLVTFKSNGTVSSTGWRAFYNTQPIPSCAGTTNLTAVNTTFDDGSAALTDYVENSNCSWLIGPPGAFNIDLTFSRFDTEVNNDVVNVYDGNSNTAPLIGTYSGMTLPPVINSTGPTLFIQFITDGIGNATGWEASYISFNTVNIDVPQDTVYINAGAGSTTSLSLSSNVTWSNTDNAAWLIASPRNGSGNTTLNLLAIQANIGPERSAELIINSSSTADADTVIVIQRTSGRFVLANPDTLYFAGDAAPSQNASLTSNVSWTLAPNQSWIITSPSTGLNNGSSSIMVQNNTGNQVRTSFVLVTGTLGASNDTVWVVQDTSIIINIPSLALDKMNITLAQTTCSSDVFTVNSNTSWQTTSGATWLTVTNPATTSDTQRVTVTANTSNLAALPRATFVAVQDVAGTLYDTVFVFQTGLAPILIGAPDTILLGASSGSTGVLNVGSTGIWTGIEGDTWFSLSQNTGTGVSAVNLTASSANIGSNQRFSYVALADAINSLTDTVVIIQDTISPGLATTPDTLRVGSAFGSSATFNVSTTLSWAATPSASWITANPNSGTGSGSITAAADANPGTVDRIAYIEVSSTGGALNTDTVWIIQQGFVANLEVNPSVVNLGFTAGSNETVNITSNTSWVITNPASWLTVSTNSGINDQMLTITTNADNLTGATRTATILVDGIGAVTKSVTVNQIDGSSPIFISSKDTVFVANVQGSTGTFSVLSNANSWALAENTSWLLINPASGAQTQTITSLVATRNTFGTTRYANITGSSNGFPDITVVIAQKEADPIFQVAPDSILVGTDSSDFTEFNVSSNMPNWNISQSATWLRVSPENGAFTQRVKATAVSRNTTGVQRSVIATITAPPLVPQTIKIVQDTVRTIGIESNDFEIGLTVYPNPSNGQVILQFDGNELNRKQASIRLFNLIGEEISIQEKFYNQSKLFLNLENQASGVYFISIELNGKTVNRKLILTE